MPPIFPLNVDSLDVSRNLARQPALPRQGSGPNAGSMHTDTQQSNGHRLPQSRRAVTLIEFDLKSHIASGTRALRPAAQANTQTIEGPRERGVPADSGQLPQSLHAYRTTPWGCQAR